ncbi:helix-turn-helix domain-containing protein [Noviherbaspirillum denitrificans]|uniref:HTH cro/C1-type domain-containing protein n=1 Tax=Noviherbaspirillum denitrificans TaxID=1968433 RepID=A0A254TGS2_9BURK|nr:helix-turn-helix transcriptional regulator [Noviherbaspirillum denitrificans]OWW21859.1 hypothetical protein AYR66_22530 [Noviherbaspirillum denitrificans]
MAKAKRASKSTAQRIGKRIRQFRAALGLTQAQLAEQLEMDDMTISRFETGLRAPSLDQLERLSAIFNVSISHFVDENDESSLVHGRELESMLKSLTKEQQGFVIDFVRAYVAVHGNNPGSGQRKLGKSK